MSIEEKEVPEVVGYHSETDDPLMTVAQHERILKAKDAELKELRDSMAFRTSLIGRLEAERDELRAQPARQVGEAEWRKALHEAVSAIYFNDSSDYLSALHAVVRCLAPDLAEDIDRDPGAVWHKTEAMISKS